MADARAGWLGRMALSLHMFEVLDEIYTTGLILPATVRNAVVRLPVEAVFDHPVLHGRGYVIGDQYERVPTADDPREAWRIEFRAEPGSWQVPWRTGGPACGCHRDRSGAPRSETPEDGDVP